MKLRLAPLMLVLASSAAIAVAPASADPAQPQSPPPAAENAVPSAERLELARQFIALANPAGDMMASFREAAFLSATAGAEDDELEAARPELERRVDRMMARVEPTIRKRMPEVLKAYARVYAREFSAEELEQLIAFAQSPAGRHYVTRIAFVDMDPEIVEADQALVDELTPIIREVTKELCTERANERLAADDGKASCPLTKHSETHTG